MAAGSRIARCSKPVLVEAGFDAAVIDASLTDATVDEEIRADHQRVLDLGGFGVPTLVLNGTTPLFGPVIAPAPTGAAAGRLWDLVVGWTDYPNLYELRRPKAPADWAHIGDLFAPYLCRPRLAQRRASCSMTTAENTAAALTAQLAETWESIERLGQGLAPEEWMTPTACPGWTVADQLAISSGPSRCSPENPHRQGKPPTFQPMCTTTSVGPTNSG